MGSTVEPSFNIPSLNFNNWFTWKADVKVLLLHYGAWKYVESSDELNEKSEDTAKTEAGKETIDVSLRKIRAYTIVYQSVSPELRPLISGTTDGQTAWKILKEHFEPCTRARVIQLLDEFFAVRYETGMNLGLFLCQVKNVAARLREAGHELPLLYFGYQMIRSLPEEYQPIVQTIYRWSDKDFVPDKIENELLLEQNRLMQVKRDLSTETAFFSKQDKSKSGAEYLSAGIVKGAALSSELIHKGASKAKQKINPEDQPVAVDPRVKEGLRIAREASGVALKASGFLVRKLGDLTVALGKQIAPHIKEQGSKLLSSTLKKDQKEANDTMDGVLTVAAGGLQGFSTIYSGLEHAARTLAYSLSSETVNIVGHKYGNELGEVVGNALFSVGNLALTTHNVQSLGVKAVAKRTAKDTGKAVLKDYVEKGKKPEKQ